MGLFDRMRARRRGAGDGGRRQLLDREATPADLEHLRVFVRTRTGVEFYVEPETTATDTTVVAVAKDGEWTRGGWARRRPPHAWPARPACRSTTSP